MSFIEMNKKPIVFPSDYQHYTNNIFRVKGQLYEIYQLCLVKYLHCYEFKANSIKDFNTRYFIRIILQPKKENESQVFKFSLETWNCPNTCRLYYVEIFSPMIEKYGKNVTHDLELLKRKEIIDLV